MNCDPIVRRRAVSAGWAFLKGTRRPESAEPPREARHRRRFATPRKHASATSLIGESLAGIAEIPGEACERAGLAPAGLRQPSARAGAHASATSRIGESLAETAETPDEASGRVALAPAAPRRPAARADAQAAATSLIGESLAGIAEIPWEACERVDLAPAAPHRPATRAGAHASAPSRIGESLAETAGTAETPGEVHPMGETAKLRTAVSIDCLGLRELRVKRGIGRGRRGAGAPMTRDRPRH